MKLCISYKVKRIICKLLVISLTISSLLTNIAFDNNIIQVQAATESESPLVDLNFNSLSENESPTGWTEDSSNKGTESSMTVIAENKVMQVSQPSARTESGYYINYNFTESTSKAILEYRFKAEEGINTAWLPSLCAVNDGANRKLHLMLTTESGTLKVKYSADGGNWFDTGAELEAGSWHTVKLEVDIEANPYNVTGNQTGLRKLYIDEKEIKLDEDHMKANICAHWNKLTGVSTGFYISGNGTYYIDDVKITSSDSTLAELNFNDISENAVPTGWAEDSSNSGTGSSTSVIAENKVMQVSQPSARTESGYYMHYNFQINDIYNAVLEYRFKAGDGVNTAWLPSVSATNTGGDKPLFLMLTTESNSLKVKYSANCGNWFDTGAELDKEGWHTLKQVVNLTTNQRELYIDGNSITLDATHLSENACRHWNPLTSVSTGFYKSGSGAYYIDNLKVTSYITDDDSGSGDDSGSEDDSGTGTETSGIAEIPFELDFNDMTVGTLPANWTADPGNSETEAEMSTLKVIEENEANKVVEVSQPNARTESSYYMHYTFKETDKAVLEYRFKSEDNVIMAWLPAFSAQGLGSDRPLHLMLTGGGTRLQYSADCWRWEDAKTNLTTGSWHTLKLVVSLSENLRELYIDGEKISLSETHLSLAGNACRPEHNLSSVSTGFYREGIGCYYIDDFKVSNYVTGTSVEFEKTEYKVAKNGSITLKPIFTPENTSIQGMSYVSSDPEIATVNENGVVTGVKYGEVTITATPHQTSLSAMTTKVIVEGDLTGTITDVEDTITLPLGGHTILEPVLTLDCEGDTTLAFASSNSDIVTVDEWGEVLATGVGEAVITISSVANAEIKKEINVFITEPSIWKTIYVSPTGNGTGNSVSEPTTLQGALEILENIDKDELTGNIEVILSEGYYYQTDTLELNENHGGNQLYTVVFKAAEGADVTIGGGIQIAGSSFTQSEKIEGAYVVNVDENIQSRQLYVDNVRATRAKRTGTLTNAEFLYDENGNNIGLKCDNTELLDCVNPDGLEFVYSSHWVHSRVGVHEIKEDNDGKVWLIMDEKGWQVAKNATEFSGFKIDRIDYYENDLILLDEPGEWYLDEVNNKLYYIPRIWETMEDVTVTIPVLDAWDNDGDGVNGLLTVTGSNYDNMVQNICFEGIAFADATWMRASSEYGHKATQNNYLGDALHGNAAGYTVDASITVKRANGVSFVDCDFTRMGTTALKLTEGVQNSMLVGNLFYDISGNAIQIGEPDYYTNSDNYNPSDIRKMMKNCDVKNNYIHDIGVEYHSSAAIGVAFVADMDISHNEIFNVPYSGLHIGYGWENKFENVLKNMNVSNNFIHDYMHEGIFDGASVYVLGNTAGNNEISENYARNQGNHAAMLYFDNGSSNWTALNNVLDSSETPIDPYTTNELHWVRINSPAENIFIKNVYTTSKTNWINPTGLENIVIENHTIVSDTNWPDEAQQIISKSGLQASYTGLRNNQAERIVTNLPADEIMGMKSGETFLLNVSATDGKDRAVNLEGAIIEFEILDDEIATVSKEGKITALKEGKTTLRIYLVSNDILNVIEKDLYVDDFMESLALEGISGDITLFAVPGTETQLNPYGITASGRELTLTNVAYELGDSSIASVSADGVLSPVKAGETTIKITGTAEGQTLSITRNIRINSAGTVSYLDDIFEEANQEYWIGNDVGDPDTTWECLDNESITTELNGNRCYSGTTYGDELLTFYLSIEKEAYWPSIYLRSQDSSTAVSSGATGYIICFTKDGMQLQRFNESERTVFYGSVTGYESIVGANVTPCALEDGELHKIQVAAVNEENGVRLLMYVDGEMIFNCLDDSEDAVRNSGYFGLIGRASNGVADKFTLVKASEETEGGNSEETEGGNSENTEGGNSENTEASANDKGSSNTISQENEGCAKESEISSSRQFAASYGAVNTGDSSTVILWMALVLLAGCTVILMKKRAGK